MNVDTALDAIMLGHAIKILQRDLPEPGEDETTLDWDTRIRATIKVLQEKKAQLDAAT